MEPKTFSKYNKSIVKPIQSLLSFNRHDLSLLSKLAIDPSVDEFSEAERSSPIYHSWLHGDKHQIREAALAGLSYLFSYINNSSAGDQLASAVKVLLTQGVELDYIEQHIGRESLKRLAMVDEQVALSYVKYNSPSLTQQTSEWLYVIMGIERSFVQIVDKKETLSAPETTAEDFGTCMDLLQIIVAHDSHPAILETIRANLSSIPPKRLDALHTIIANTQNEGMLNGLREWAVNKVENKPFKYGDILKVLQEADPKVLLATYRFLVLGEHADEISEKQVTDLSLRLNGFSINDLFRSLCIYLNSQEHAASIEEINQQFQFKLSALSKEQLSYIFVHLYLHEPPLEQLNIEVPTEANRTICDSLIEQANTCPALWSMVHNTIAENLPPRQMMMYVLAATYHYQQLSELVSEQIGHEARLWLFLAMSTNSDQEVFRIQNSVNEFVDSTIIRNPHISNINPIFMAQANKSEILKELMLRAISNSEDKKFEELIRDSVLYLRYFAEEKVSVLTQNNCAWLYFALTLNSRSAALRLGSKTITSPQGHQETFAEQVFKAVEHNSGLKYLFIKALERKAHPDDISLIKLIQTNYIRSLASKINPEEQRWLAATLLSTQVENVQELYHGRKFRYQAESESTLSKLMHVATLNPENKQFLYQLLTEEEGLVADVVPMIFTLGPLINYEQSPGSFVANNTCHPKIAAQSIPLCLASLSPFDIAWLKASLKLGEFVYSNHPVLKNPLLMLQGAVINQAPGPLATLIVNYIKYPDLRARLCQAIGLDVKEINEPKSMILDRLPLEDEGFHALLQAINQTTPPLEFLSLNQCNLTSKHLNLLDDLVSKGPLRKLHLDKSMLDTKGFASIRRWAELNPNTIPLLISSLSNHLEDENVLGILSTQLELSHWAKDSNHWAYQHPDILRASTDLAPYYFLNEASKNVFECMHSLLQHPKVDHLKRSLASASDEYSNIMQLIHVGLEVHEPRLLCDVMSILLHKIPGSIRPLLQAYVSDSVVLTPDYFQQQIFIGEQNQQNINLFATMLTILPILMNSQKDSLGKLLDIEPGYISNPQIIDLSAFSMPSHMQAILAKSINLTDSVKQFSPPKQFDLSSLHSPSLVRLNISYQTFDMNNIGDLLACLRQCPQLKTLDISHCTFDDKSFEALVQTLADSPVRDIIMPGNLDDASRLSINQLSALQRLLMDEHCGIHTLDLSNRQLSAAGAVKFIEGLTKNKSLETLNLNHCVTNRTVRLAILKLLKDHPSLKDISIQAHNGGLEYLEQIHKAIKNNRHIMNLDYHCENLDLTSEQGASLSQKIKMILLKNELEQTLLHDIDEGQTNVLQFSAPSLSVPDESLQYETKERDNLRKTL